MHLFWICLLIFAHNVFCFSSVKEHLDTHLSHTKPKVAYVDAAFLVRLEEYENLEKLKEEFFNCGLPLTEYNNFNVIPDKTLKEFCSPVISPYLLTQILSHLSIYQYCLNNNIQKALVIEDQAQIVADPHKIHKIIEKLEESRTPWDVIYSDIDFHSPETGQFIAPRIETIPKNKEVVDLNISRIFCRYGTTSYIISSSGMKKVLNYFAHHWDNLPFDQMLFKVPNINVYGSNIDLITNKYKTKKTERGISLTKVNTFYETGSEFWLDPLQLLTFDRFDVTAKYIYAKYYLNNYKTNWHVNLYKSTLEKWVRFYNTEPLKVGFQAFETSFVSLVNNLREKHFDPKFPLPINNLGLANDGSHRIATCLALDLPMKIKVESGNSSPEMSAANFRNLYKLEEKYLDHMAYEYAKLKKNTHIACLFPIAHEFQKEAEEILNAHGHIIHYKDIWLTDSGTVEFVRAVNIGQWGVTSSLNNYESSRKKAQLSFPTEKRNKYPVRVYLYESNNLKAIDSIRQEILTLCQKGDVAAHINNTHRETKIIAATVFNQNSIDFLNKRKLNSFENFDFLFEKLQNFIAENNLDSELLCIDTGSVLSALGLRDCNDMDILHWNPLPSSFKKYKIDSHNPHLHHHSTSLDEILFNPECHFYYEGIKFVAPDLVKKMKADRSSLKDIRDIKLIESLEIK